MPPRNLVRKTPIFSTRETCDKVRRLFPEAKEHVSASDFLHTFNVDMPLKEILQRFNSDDGFELDSVAQETLAAS